MTWSSLSGPYWAVDVPGLTEGQAHLLSDFVTQAGIAEGAILLDPQYWLTRSMDRSTVESLSSAVKAALAGEKDLDEIPILQGLDEDFDEWLGTAH